MKYFLPEDPVEGTQKAAEQKISEPKVPDNKVYEPKVSAPKTIVPEIPVQTEAEVSSISELADIEHYLTKSALAVRKNIRSGQKISYDGTLIIFGDVNAGAELEAAGHILVLGALRGVAHAGCKGDKKAVIYANQLRSVQLRIADLIARAPDGENTKRNIPEIARIIDNYLVIEEV